MPESDLRLEAIAVRLTQTIPAPAKAIPRPQMSWRTLKPGQLLSNKIGWKTPRGEFPPGALFLVKSVDSLGMTLSSETPAVGVRPDERWDTPDWASTFTKIPKRKKKK